MCRQVRWCSEAVIVGHPDSLFPLYRENGGVRV
jgi:hypothetical protein